jgi:hypothetical protein
MAQTAGRFLIAATLQQWIASFCCEPLHCSMTFNVTIDCQSKNCIAHAAISSCIAAAPRAEAKASRNQTGIGLALQPHGRINRPA